MRIVKIGGVKKHCKNLTPMRSNTDVFQYIYCKTRHCALSSIVANPNGKSAIFQQGA